MAERSNENPENRGDTTDVRLIGGPQGCPSWCIYPGQCAGDHLGKSWGTVATGGLPPGVDGPEPPTYNTVTVRPQHPEADGLTPGVALFGSFGDRDWQVDLTIREARILLEGLTAAISTAQTA